MYDEKSSRESGLATGVMFVIFALVSEYICAATSWAFWVTHIEYGGGLILLIASAILAALFRNKNNDYNVPSLFLAAVVIGYILMFVGIFATLVLGGDSAASPLAQVYFDYADDPASGLIGFFAGFAQRAREMVLLGYVNGELAAGCLKGFFYLIPTGLVLSIPVWIVCYIVDSVLEGRQGTAS